MKKPSFPINENERLQTLKSYKVLDTEFEISYDEIVQLASEICKTPIAAISLIDTDRQWFKAIVGLDARETHRDISFCGHAIHSEDIFEIPNAKADVRFQDNPLVTGPLNITFYAGAPLIAPNGHKIGTICVIGHDKKTLTDEQKKSLKTLSKHIVCLLELNKLNSEHLNTIREVKDLNQKFTNVINYMNEGYVFQNKTGEIIEFNNRALDILGLSEDQLKGRTSFDPRWRSVKENEVDFPGNEHPAIVAINTGKSITNTIMGLYLPNETKRWISINATPVFAPENSNEAIGAITTFADITKQHEQNLKLSLTLKTSGFGQWEWNLVTNELIWDDVQLGIFEVSREEFEKHFITWENCVHPEDLDSANASIEKVILENIDLNMIYRIITKSKKIKYVQAKGYLIRNKDGAPFKMIGFNWDVTSEVLKNEKYNQEANKMSLLMHLAPVGMFETDRDGKCVFVNNYWLQLTGMTEEESMGDGWIHAIHPDDRDKVFYEWGEALKHDHRFLIEYRLINNRGDIFYVMGNAQTLHDKNGNTTGFLGSIQDVSSLKYVQNELESAKAYAENLTNIKSEFLASMSHEIRTPMNGVLGMANLLNETTLTDEQKDYVNSIQRSGEGLLSIINDILDISKMESGKFTFEPTQFELFSLIKDTTNLLSPLTKKKNLQFKTTVDKSTSHYWLGDSGRIRQVLNNILGNAIKFTETGTVELNCSPWIIGENVCGLKFVIKDTGIGISAENIDKLFNNFVQANESIHRKFGGTGLGLAITKKLCELMNGHIDVNSTLGLGSTFTIYLGLAEVSKDKLTVVDPLFAITTPETNLHLDYSSFKILIAEDNPVNQKVIQGLLTKIGFKYVDLAINGNEALQMFNNFKYDLIFMDCMMPELDGHKTTEIIRKFEMGTNKRIPIVAMTANAMAGDEEKCYQSGMDDYLTKPINLIKLKSCLYKWLSKLKTQKAA